MGQYQTSKISLISKSWTILTSIGLSLIFLTMPLYAAKPSNPVCTITAAPNPVLTGQSVAFESVVSSGTAPYEVTWTFSGGIPLSDSASLNDGVSVTHNIAYNSVGSFTAVMAATDSGKRSRSCEASVTINVSVAGNNPPVAQNDDYNTLQDTQLVINAPGVLSNDNDPNGDPMSVVLVDNVSNGVLSLASDGSFSYDPNPGFSGQDSFIYIVEDGNGPPSNVATVVIGVTPAGVEVSINSTAANAAVVPDTAVTEQPFFSNPNFTLVAANDLGMHCGDLDTRISSILPPFNVLHAQVIERGVTGLPRVMGKDEVDIFYSTASNPDDPAISRVAGGQALSSIAADGSVYKNNFWDIAFQAYDPFYPSGILAAFYDPDNPANNVDLGLPVPDVERLYLGDGNLHASQQAMPGIGLPYADNVPQIFQEHIGTLPFFSTFAFGYTADLNLFEAAGVPVSAFDDFGRENPYPLVRVQAKQGVSTIASLDVVMPISGEASCQSCHSADVGSGDALANLASQASAMDDPLHNDSVPFEVSVEWASDINILRLHDQKHDTSLDLGFDANTGRAANPVVCQTCHYTPALDLAQFGPLGPENDGPLVLNGVTVSDSKANGRDQFKNKSMSNVMHSHHNSTGLFPIMPPAIDGQGNRRDPLITQTILQETCYLCHPGERTQCMRGAMANGGLVCQDCHGQMQDVGDDFSRDVSATNPGNFHLAADFYDNPATPRVPWANEPGCGSCHTGYATDNLAGDPDVLVSPTDVQGNSDGIRLLAAYRQNDAKATPIVPVNKAFAENVVDEGTAADGNPKLYRVSTGHGGLMCEACHGSTHAEWPTANPNANDNIPAGQLQGHSGYIAECTVCHEPTDASLPLGNNGPHGMHAVTDLEPVAPAKADDRWNRKHRNFRNQGPGCESCHGADLTGTVLSRTADDRTVHCKDRKGSLPECAAGEPTAIIPKGTPVGCGLCHRQKR